MSATNLETYIVHTHTHLVQTRFAKNENNLACVAPNLKRRCYNFVDILWEYHTLCVTQYTGPSQRVYSACAGIIL